MIIRTVYYTNKCQRKEKYKKSLQASMETKVEKRMDASLEPIDYRNGRRRV